MKILSKSTNAQGNQVIQFHAKLVSPLSETTLQNSNGTNYKLVTVEFENAKGETKQVSASIYEGNYSKGVTVGQIYLTTATIVDKKVYLQMSHLTGAPRPDLEDFAGMFDAVPTSVLAAN